MNITDIIEYLACPKCKGELIEEIPSLFCSACDLKFPVVNGIPYLLLDHALSGEGNKHTSAVGEKYWDDAKKSASYLISDSPMRRYMDVIEVEEPIYWLKPAPDDLILDLGCGSGRQLGVLSNKNKIIGVDRSVGMLQRAKKIMNEKNGFLVLGDAMDIPFRANVFNKITSVRVIQHLDDDEKMRTINECHRILGEGGVLQIVNYRKWTPHHLYIVISLSLLRYPLNLIAFLIVLPLSLIVKLWRVKINPFSRIFSWKHPEIARFSSSNELVSQLRQAQFKNIRVRNFQVGDVFLSTILSRAWSGSSNGTVSKTFSVSKLFFPRLTEIFYKKWLQIDRQARTRKSPIWYFRSKDKIIAMATKRARQ